MLLQWKRQITCGFHVFVIERRWRVGFGEWYKILFDAALRFGSLFTHTTHSEVFQLIATDVVDLVDLINVIQIIIIQSIVNIFASIKLTNNQLSIIITTRKCAEPNKQNYIILSSMLHHKTSALNVLCCWWRNILGENIRFTYFISTYSRYPAIFCDDLFIYLKNCFAINWLRPKEFDFFLSWWSFRLWHFQYFFALSFYFDR